MKRFIEIVLGLFSVLVFVGCSRWPTVVVGDSSGMLHYNRATGVLEVLWEKHVQTADTVQKKPSPNPANLDE